MPDSLKTDAFSTSFTMPPSIVPVPPVHVEHSSVHDWKVCATWAMCDGPAFDHLYAIDVLAAAAADRDVWEALAEATLAGLCMRCSPQSQVGHLLTRHVMPVVVERAAEFVWAHSPLLGVECGGCQIQEGAIENG